jgi:hypothetical protein
MKLNKREIAIFLLGLSIIVLQLFLVVDGSAIRHFQVCLDTIEYWSATHLFISGMNPYDAAELLRLQKSYPEYPFPDALIAWNPPWLFAFITPIFQGSYEIGARVWILLSLIAVGVSGYLWLQTFQFKEIHQKKSFFWIIAGFTFFPAQISNILLGQLGSFLLLGASLLRWSFVGKNRMAFILGIIFLSFKPQFLFYFLIALGLISLLQKKRWIFENLIVTGILLVVFAFFFPKPMYDWVQTLGSGINNQMIAGTGTPLLQWIPSTLSGMIRLALFHFGYGVTRWPSIIISILGLCIVIYIILKKFDQKLFSCSSENTLFEKSTRFDGFLLILLITVLCSPYGWLHDFLILLPIHLKVIQNTVRLKENVITGILILILPTLYSLSLHFFGFHSMHLQFLFPWFVGISWLLSDKLNCLEVKNV